MAHLLPRFEQILARRPAPNMATGMTSVDLGIPDYALAMQQYDTYLDALRNLGLQVSVLDADERYPDGHFVEDPIIVFRDMAFLCRSGTPSRREEGESLLPHLPEFNIMRIESPDAFVDGGDVLFCADCVLIGLSERTNEAGAIALNNALKSVQPDLNVQFVPFSGVLHLKSGLTELAPNVLVCDPALETEFALDWAEVITLPAAEGHGADVMPINDALFIVDDCPTLREIAERYYEQVVVLNMSEFQKMDGGLTCLSLRY